ncbi:MAG: signal peptide peptidase SppA [Anaerolineae bacterium]|nr:signal peptide peptidase SppA [Anaerolineae bacterium]
MSEEINEPMPTVADTAVVPPPPPAPTVIQVKSEGNGRTPAWVLAGVSLGFLLPVCACGFLMVTFFFSVALAGSASPATSSGGFGDAIAIVRVEGAITHSDDAQSPLGAVSGTVINDLRVAAADDSVKAIILRVDSPGGTVTGSAQIHDALAQIEKPVVVSMAGTAASGGYYVSAPADYIFARPDTTTGSLGVVLTLYNVTELLDNVGVSVTSITSGPNKTIGNPWEPLTAEQEAILQTIADEAYDGFVQVIVDGRSLPEEEVRALADGRIYTGNQALALGLVDELGDLPDAITKAATLGGITGEPRIVEYEHLPNFSDFFTGFSSRVSKSEAEQTMELVTSLITPQIEYRYIGSGAN